jgi:hypothetical protein
LTPRRISTTPPAIIGTAPMKQPIAMPVMPGSGAHPADLIPGDADRP